MSARSYGFIETKGLIGAVEAADAMVKAANVNLVRRRNIDAALVTVICEGDLASCQAAVAAGRVAAARVGELVSAHVIARPDDDTESLVMVMLGHGPLPVKPAPATPAGPAPTPAAKPAEAPKSRPAGSTDHDDKLITLLAGRADGLTCEEICEALNMEKAEVLQLAKRSMDAGAVEKVHRKYYARPGGHQ